MPENQGSPNMLAVILKTHGIIQKKDLYVDNGNEMMQVVQL